MKLKGENSLWQMKKNGKIQTSYDEIKEKLRESIVREWTEEEGKVAWTEYQVYSKQNVDAFLQGQEAAKIAYANQKLREYYDSLLLSESFLDYKGSWIDMYKKLSALDPDTHPAKSDEELNVMVDSSINLPEEEPIPPAETVSLNPITFRAIGYTAGIEKPDWDTLQFPNLEQTTIMDDVNGILSTSKKYTDKRMQEINNSRDRLVEKDASVRESLSTFDNAYSSMLIAQGAFGKINLMIIHQVNT